MDCLTDIADDPELHLSADAYSAEHERSNPAPYAVGVLRLDEFMDILPPLPANNTSLEDLFAAAAPHSEDFLAGDTLSHSPVGDIRDQIPSQVGRAPPEFSVSRATRRSGRDGSVSGFRNLYESSEPLQIALSGAGSRRTSRIGTSDYQSVLSGVDIASSAGITGSVDDSIITGVSLTASQGVIFPLPTFYQRNLTCEQREKLPKVYLTKAQTDKIWGVAKYAITAEAFVDEALFPDGADADKRALRALRNEFARLYPGKVDALSLSELHIISKATLETAKSHAKTGVISSLVARLTDSVEPKVDSKKRNDFSALVDLGDIRFGLFKLKDGNPPTAAVVSERALNLLSTRWFLGNDEHFMCDENFQTLAMEAFYERADSIARRFPDLFQTACPKKAIVAIALVAIFYRRRSGGFERNNGKAWIATAKQHEAEISAALEEKLRNDPVVRANFNAMLTRIPSISILSSAAIASV
ncbi:hypothetical protein BJ138DRAFT_1119360 [Hygrophoropsis aurantiaca]|uniref:Uncharacterized protein n=1 Tax=Hygrophoropsis aurantiaca TaxID=72124 RepID=A0ACB7ZTK6_9AGAM|nr:hypothetical protein BJ138DRAFT_1119360 [Hygrophoropsis aurantiaca]